MPQSMSLGKWMKKSLDIMEGTVCTLTHSNNRLDDDSGLPAPKPASVTQWSARLAIVSVFTGSAVS